MRRSGMCLLVAVFSLGGCAQLVTQCVQINDGNLRVLQEKHGAGAASLEPGYVFFHNKPFDDARLAEALPLLKAYGVSDLDLNGRDITDASVPGLLRLRRLKRLQLQGTHVSFDGLEQLGALPALRVLVIEEGIVSSERLRELRLAMPKVDIQEDWITVRKYDPKRRYDGYPNFAAKYPKYARWVR